jgi:LacI family transcriptional regulator
MAQFDRTVQIRRTMLKTDDAKVVAQAIDRTDCEGLIFYPIPHPLIEEAVAAAQARGVQIVTIFSDLPGSSRLAYAGTNQYEVGRTAGYFMGHMAKRSGPICILCAHSTIVGDKQRIAGFTDSLALHAPQLRVTKLVEGDDDSRKSELLLMAAFHANRDFVGLYNVGTANNAAAAAIKEGILKGIPVFIGHELTDETRPLLRDGVMALVIDQNPEHQARFALDVLLHHFGYTEERWLQPPYKSNIPLKVYCVENMTIQSRPDGS